MNIELAVVKGAVLRLRPVLITASVAALGMMPMLFATARQRDSKATGGGRSSAVW